MKFAADDKFPLQRHVMKPHPSTQARGSEKRIYNYRLSRTRKIVENAFGILSAVFCVLRKHLLLQPHKASLVTMICVHLHNYLMKRKDRWTELKMAPLLQAIGEMWKVYHNFSHYPTLDEEILYNVKIYGKNFHTILISLIFSHGNTILHN